MLLVAVIAAIVVNHLFPVLDGWRRWGWLRAWRKSVRQMLGASAAGTWSAVMLTMFPVVFLLYWLLGGYQVTLLNLPLVFVAFLFSLGPRDLRGQMEKYQFAAATRDADQAARLGAELCHEAGIPDAAPDPMGVCRATLILVNERLFAPMFWAVVLGPFGCLAYRAVVELAREPVEVEPGFHVRSARVQAALEWLPARLTALSYALAGSLTHSISLGRPGDRWGLAHNHAVLGDGGIGALQRDDEPLTYGREELLDLLRELRGLVGRALSIWLVVLSVGTIGGLI